MFQNDYGDNPKFAKECNNVIDDVFFRIPLNQVWKKKENIF